MIDPLTLSIGIGLVFGLVFVEAFGLFAGGMVVPGYIALDLTNPMSILFTIVAALLINVVIRFMAKYFVIYGRRRVSLTVLLAYLVGWSMRSILGMPMVVEDLGGLYTVIGYIIPGLIALSIDRQGIIETLSTLLTVAVAVRLVLIILIGPVLLQ